MSSEITPFINPVHAIFPFIDLNRPETTLARFFELCDALDPIDRDALIGLTAFALGVQSQDIDDEDAEQEIRYEKFKKACHNIPAMDHVILRGVVQEIMNIHHRWSDATIIDQRIESIKGFIEFAKSRGTSGEDLEKYRLIAEEKQVGKTSDLQVARRRYELFCNSVVRPLIGFQ